MSDNLSTVVRAIYDQLIKEVTKLRNQVGSVTGTTGTKVNVTVGSTAMVLSRLASYTPTVGDVVLIDVSVGNWLVIGKIQP